MALDLKSFSKDGHDVEVQSMKETKDGVEILAQAFKDNKQVGFGEDGSVDIERFKIYRPPVLVPDGTTRKVYVEALGMEIEMTNFKHDPEEAIRQTLAHTVKVANRPGTIIPGKVGNTTSTFYPSSDSGIYSEDATWATAHDAATGTTIDDPAYCWVRWLSGSGYGICRYFASLDTSAIPDGDTISAATFSLYGTTSAGVRARTYNVYDSTNSDTVVAGDYDTGGTTAQCDTAITQAGWATSAYNDWVLNATGLGNISKTATLTKFCLREGTYDVPDTQSEGTEENTFVTFSSVEETGTSQDPKLVVTHAAGGGGDTLGVPFLGVAP